MCWAMHELYDSIILFRRFWREVSHILGVVPEKVWHENLKVANVIRNGIESRCENVGAS